MKRQSVQSLFVSFVSALRERVVSPLSRWRTLLVLTLSASAVLMMGSSARSQTEWSDDSSPSAIAGKKPTPPPSLQIDGPWVGQIQDAQEGAGTVSLNFTQKNSKPRTPVKGSWKVTFPSTAPSGGFTDVGAQTGSVTANSLALTLHHKRGNRSKCNLVFTSTEASQVKITGTYRFVCSNDTGTISIEPAHQGPVVDVEDDFFAPTHLVITKGQTVLWNNKGRLPHTVTSNPGCSPSSSEAFASPLMLHGAVFDHTFNDPGTFAYHCQVHGCEMKGSITVVP